MDRLGAHGVNSLSGLRGYGGGNYQRTTNPGAPGSNAEWGICFAGAAGICDGELDWRIDFADGAGNGRVRKPGIRAVKTLRNLPQAPCYELRTIPTPAISCVPECAKDEMAVAVNRSCGPAPLTNVF